MKKLIIFESILIIFFVLAWNVSKAENLYKEIDGNTKKYCTEIKWSLMQDIRQSEGYLRCIRENYNIWISSEKDSKEGDLALGKYIECTKNYPKDLDESIMIKSTNYRNICGTFKMNMSHFDWVEFVEEKQD